MASFFNSRATHIQAYIYIYRLPDKSVYKTWSRHLIIFCFFDDLMYNKYRKLILGIVVIKLEKNNFQLCLHPKIHFISEI
jgi:hypothetical protein